MVNVSRLKRRWLRWCRYANRYLKPGLSVGDGPGLMRLYNRSAARGWPWP